MTQSYGQAIAPYSIIYKKEQIILTPKAFGVFNAVAENVGLWAA